MAPWRETLVGSLLDRRGGGGKHKLEHANDARYGNRRSWISSEDGGGGVEIEFDRQRTIDRVVWGRDRDGKFKDRLAVQYTISVAREVEWFAVASSKDRLPVTSQKRPVPRSTAGLLPDEAAKVNRLQAEKRELEKEHKAATAQQLVFAGRFTKPDKTHRLLRGDPEQPREEVAPAVIEVLGDVKLPGDSAVQRRRMALSDWITSPEHPLASRVMVNRIWQWHFGRALVDTANDFGRNGAKPTHPELLDWLNRCICLTDQFDWMNSLFHSGTG